MAAAAAVGSAAKAKAGGGKQGGKGSKAAAEKDKATTILEAALKPSVVGKVALTDDELRKAADMAKEYSRRKLREHREQQAGESARLKLKLAAIQALPAGKLREAAMEPDFTPFPSNRCAPTWTPPVENVGEVAEARAQENVPLKKRR